MSNAKEVSEIATTIQNRRIGFIGKLGGMEPERPEEAYSGTWRYGCRRSRFDRGLSRS